VLFGSFSNSNTISKQSDMCLYTHIFDNIKNIIQQWIRSSNETFRMPFWTRVSWDREPLSGINSPNTPSPYHTFPSSEDVANHIPVIWNFDRLYSIRSKNEHSGLNNRQGTWYLFIVWIHFILCYFLFDRLCWLEEGFVGKPVLITGSRLFANVFVFH
jgi:hypothetical protein